MYCQNKTKQNRRKKPQTKTKAHKLQILQYLKPLLFYQKENVTGTAIRVLTTFWTISTFTHNEIMKLCAKKN